MQYENFFRLFRFSIIGIFNTSAYFAIANALVQILGLTTSPASYLAYGLVLPFSFAAHRRLTFRSNGNVIRQWGRFIVVQAGCVALIAVVNWSAEGLSPADSWMAFAAISVLIPASNFMIMHVWVFSRR